MLDRSVSHGQRTHGRTPKKLPRKKFLPRQEIERIAGLLMLWAEEIEAMEKTPPFPSKGEQFNARKRALTLKKKVRLAVYDWVNNPVILNPWKQRANQVWGF